MATILEREAEHKKHMKELEEACTEFSHEVDKIRVETEARVRPLNTTYEVLTTQFWNSSKLNMTIWLFKRYTMKGRTASIHWL